MVSIEPKDYAFRRWLNIPTRWWFQIFLFSSLFGEDSHFDEHIFQMGWNHQLANHYLRIYDGRCRIGIHIHCPNDSIFRCAPPQAVVLHRKPTSLPYAWSISECLFFWRVVGWGRRKKKHPDPVGGFADMFFFLHFQRVESWRVVFEFRIFLDWTLENSCSVLFDCGLWTLDCFLDWGKGSEFVVASYHTHIGSMYGTFTYISDTIHGWYRRSYDLSHNFCQYVWHWQPGNGNLPPAPATGCVHVIMRCFSQLVSEREALNGNNPAKGVYHDMVF